MMKSSKLEQQNKCYINVWYATFVHSPKSVCMIGQNGSHAIFMLLKMAKSARFADVQGDKTSEIKNNSIRKSAKLRQCNVGCFCF